VQRKNTALSPCNESASAAMRCRTPRESASIAASSSASLADTAACCQPAALRLVCRPPVLLLALSGAAQQRAGWPTYNSKLVALAFAARTVHPAVERSGQVKRCHAHAPHTLKCVPAISQQASEQASKPTNCPALQPARPSANQPASQPARPSACQPVAHSPVAHRPAGRAHADVHGRLAAAGTHLPLGC